MSRPAMQGYQQNPNMFKQQNGPQGFPPNGQPNFPPNGQPNGQPGHHNMYQQPNANMNGYAMQNGHTSPPNSMPMRPPVKVNILQKNNIQHLGSNPYIS